MKKSEAKNKGNFKANKILVAVDFSKHSRIAMNYALSIAKMTGAKITLLHVFEKPTIPKAIWMSKQIIDIYTNYHKHAEKKAKNELEYFAHSFDAGGIELKTRVVSGIPYLEIVNVANKEKADMIVVGTRGLTVFQKMLIGSTADRVVRKANCNVLVVRK